MSNSSWCTFTFSQFSLNITVSQICVRCSSFFILPPCGRRALNLQLHFEYQQCGKLNQRDVMAA